MTLSHTTHSPSGRADILQDGGKPTERKVGMSKRIPFPMGGYLYTIRNIQGEQVYSGSSMADGLKALERCIQEGSVS